MDEETKIALARLVALASEDTGGSRVAANFLLAWWNAAELGGFDPTEMWLLDELAVRDLLQVANFINPAGLQPNGQNLFLETASSGAPTANTPGTNGTGLLNQGYVETSNVNVVEELVNMIQTQRAYEINSRAIQVSDQMLQRLSQM